MRWSRVALVSALLSLSTAACTQLGDEESETDEQNLGAAEQLVPGEFLIRHPGGTAPEIGLSLRATGPGKGQAVLHLSANPNDVRDYELTFLSRDACAVILVGKGVDPLYGETETGDTVVIYDHRAATGICDIAAELSVEETVRGAKLWWLGREGSSDGGAPHATDGGAPHATDGGAPHAIDGGAPHAIDSGAPHAIDSGAPHAIDSGAPHAIDSGAPHAH